MLQEKSTSTEKKKYKFDSFYHEHGELVFELRIKSLLFYLFFTIKDEI